MTAAETPVLRVRGLVKRFRGLVATDGAALDVRRGELHALIGPNGAGKSTLVNQITGELRHDAGSIEFDGHDIGGWPADRRARAGLVRSYQITSVFNEFSALENVMLAVQAGSGRHFALWRDTLRDPALTGPALAALAQVGLEGQAHTPVAEIGHGGRRQLELAMALAMQPRLMLLDEPLAGMSQAESAAMTRLLQGLKGRVSMLLIEHDMEAVFALADRVTVLVAGRPLLTGTPQEVRESATVREAYLGEPEEWL